MRITKFMKVTTLVAALGGAALISGCSDDSKSGGDTPSVTDTLTIGTIGAVPTNNPMASFPLQVFNNTGKQMELKNLSISLANGTKVTNAEQVAEYIDDSACKSIAAHGSCTLTVKNSKLVDAKGVGTSGTYAISLTASIEKTNISYTTEQVVSYQHFAIDPKATSVVYSNIGAANKISVKSASDRSGVTMPLYFPNAANVALNAPENLGSSLIGCGNAVNGVYHINAGSSCSIVSSFSGGKNFTYQVSLSQVSALQGLKSGKVKSLKVASNPVVFVSSIINTVIAQAYLVAGAANSGITADGVASLSLYFLNNGNATATSLNPSITYNGQTQPLATTMTFGSGPNAVTFGTSSNNCTSVLVGGVCTINVTVSASIANTFTTNVTYNGGLNSDAAYYTVYFAPVFPVPILSVTGGNFLNSVVGTPVTQTFTVTNNSTTNTTFSALSVIKTVALSAGAQTEAFTTSNNTCTTDLTQGSTCSYQVTYNPTIAITSSNNVQFQQPTTYTFNGQTVNYQALNAPQYSAVSNTTDILFSVNTLQEVTPLNTQTQKVVTLTNNSSSTISNIAFNFSQLVPSATGVSIGTNGCTGSLAVGATCTVQFIWAPTGVSEVADTGNILVAYNMNGTPATGDILPANFVGTTSGINIVAESFVAVASTSSLLSGAGSQSSPYLFYNTGDEVTFTLTYQNTGTATASNVAVDISMLPYGFTLTGATTCGYGSTTSTLLPNATCNLVFTGLRTAITDGATASKILNFTIPNVTNVDTTESNQSYIANMLTLGNSSTLYVTSQPLVSLGLTQGTPYQITDGSGHYMTQESMVFTSLLSNITGAPNLNINLSAPVSGGVWNATNAYGGTATFNINTISPAESNSSSLVYANYNGSASTSFGYTVSLVAKSVTAVIYSASLNIPVTGVYYTTNSNSIVAYQANPNGVTFNQIGSATALSFTPTQLVQSNDYLYAINPANFGGANDGIWSSAITPRGSAEQPAANAGTLAAFVQYPNSTIGNTESINYLTFNQSGTTAYILDSESNAYISCTASAGSLSACAPHALTGTSTGSLSSIAADNTGNIFVTQGTTLYACGTTGTCSGVSLPSAITTTSTSGATVAGIAVAVSGGSVYVNQYLTENLVFNTTPAVTNVAIATYTGSSVGSFAVNTSYGSNLQMATPAIVQYNYANTGGGLNAGLANNTLYFLNASQITAGMSSYYYYSVFIGSSIASTGTVYSFGGSQINQLGSNTSVPLAAALYSFF